MSSHLLNFAFESCIGKTQRRAEKSKAKILTIATLRQIGSPGHVTDRRLRLGLSSASLGTPSLILVLDSIYMPAKNPGYTPSWLSRSNPQFALNRDFNLQTPPPHPFRCPHFFRIPSNALSATCSYSVSLQSLKLEDLGFGSIFLLSRVLLLSTEESCDFVNLLSSGYSGTARRFGDQCASLVRTVPYSRADRSPYRYVVEMLKLLSILPLFREPMLLKKLNLLL